MKPAAFDYKRPANLDDALKILADLPDATIIAGGQSLLPMLGLRITAAEVLVDIAALEPLHQVREENGHVFFGALKTHAAFEDGNVPDPGNGLLSRVASKIAYRAVRNVGTIGGSLALADPSADWPACLLALDATAVVASCDGERRVRLADFLIDAYETALLPGEILVGIEVPHLEGRGWGVGKVMRKSGAFADSLAVAVPGGSGNATRIALTGTVCGARLLPRTAALIDGVPDAPAEDLAPVIAEDIEEIDPDMTPYQRRCHVSTVTKAVLEARQ